MSLKSQLGRFVRTKMGLALGGRLVTITYRNFRFKVDLGDGVVSWRLILGMGFEEKSKDLLLAMLRSRDEVIDVGANIGDYTLPIARAVGPHGKVWAFEPVGRSFHVLLHNIRQNNAANATPIESAVGDLDGTCTMHCDSSNFGGNSLKAESTVDCGEAIQVPIVRLDTFCSQNNISPDLVKADVQGAELLLLRGARSLNKNTKTAFWLEYWPAGLLTFGVSPQDFEQEISANGRSVYRVMDGKLIIVRKGQLGDIPLPGGFVDLVSVPPDWLESRQLQHIVQP